MSVTSRAYAQHLEEHGYVLYLGGGQYIDLLDEPLKIRKLRPPEEDEPPTKQRHGKKPVEGDR